MFEKEAKEYLKKDGTKAEQILDMLNEISPLKITLKQAPFILAMIQQVFKDGAEFGYNKCKEELNHKGLALQSDMDKTIEQNIALKKELNKANEWHFVSKEGFPNKDDIYLIIRSDGLHLGDYCCGGDGDIDCQSWCDYPSEEEIQDDSVIAWKEITLPEEE